MDFLSVPNLMPVKGHFCKFLPSTKHSIFVKCHLSFILSLKLYFIAVMMGDKDIDLKSYLAVIIFVLSLKPLHSFSCFWRWFFF